MDNELSEYMEKYENTFKDKFSLFFVDADPEEAVALIKKCLDKHKTVEELLDITYDENTLY